MFNFASKVFNTIGDLINVEDPAKPPVGSQQQSQTQLRRPSGDSTFFQQPRNRFHGPTSLSDHNSFRGPGPGSALNSGVTARDQRSSASNYRYLNPVSSAASNSSNSNQATSAISNGTRPHVTPSNYNPASTSGYGNTNITYGSPDLYRPSDRYEENKLIPQDTNYKKDGLETNSSNRQSLIVEMQREYGIFNDDDPNNYKEEDRYSPNCEYETDRRRRRRRSLNDKENFQNRSSSNCRDTNSVYQQNAERNCYDTRRSDQQNSLKQQEVSTYDHQDTAQYCSENTYIDDERRRNSFSDESQFNTNEFAQFYLNSWVNEDGYHKSQQRWRTDDNLFDNKDEKVTPSPPSQDEDIKNSSRSESESSDEISFGEALATGLIPSNITPEMAARLNIELMNHPKAVIESFYGHSPGEVYTIPEEEDEIRSPTGADGVTSLRKQRMASVRVETSANVTKELQNQIRISLNQSDLRQKQRHGGINQDVNQFNQRSLTEESKTFKSIMGEQLENKFTNISYQVQSTPNLKFKKDDEDQKQQFRCQPLFQSNSSSQFNPMLTQQQQMLENQAIQQQQFSQSERQMGMQENLCPKSNRQDNRQKECYVDNWPSETNFGKSNPPFQNLSADNHQTQLTFISNDRNTQECVVDNHPVSVCQNVNRLPPTYTGNLQLQQGYAESSSPQKDCQNIRQFQNTYYDNRQSHSLPDNHQSQFVEGFRPLQQSHLGDCQQQQILCQQKVCQPDSRQIQVLVGNQIPEVYTNNNHQSSTVYAFEGIQSIDKTIQQSSLVNDRQAQLEYEVNSLPSTQDNYSTNKWPPQLMCSFSNNMQQEQQQEHFYYSQLQQQQQQQQPQQIQCQQYQQPYRHQQQQQQQQPQKQQRRQQQQIRQPQQQQMQQPQQQKMQQPQQQQIQQPQQQQIHELQQQQIQQRQQQQLIQQQPPPHQLMSCCYHESRQVKHLSSEEQQRSSLQFEKGEQCSHHDKRLQDFYCQEFCNQKFEQDSQRLDQCSQEGSQSVPYQDQTSTQLQHSNQSCQFERVFNCKENDQPLQQNFQQTGFVKQGYQGSRRRNLPETPDNISSFPDQHSSRKRVPLRKSNSEERHGNLQSSYKHSQHDIQSHEKINEKYDLQERNQRTKYHNTSRQRSSSLEAQERSDQYSRSRSSSLHRHKEGEQQYESHPRQRKILPRTQSEYEEPDQRRRQMQYSVNQRSPTPEKMRKSHTTDDQKHFSTAKDPKSAAEPSRKQSAQKLLKKGENFCPQHKKFNSSGTNVMRPVRRMLPKEPVLQPSQRINIKRQTPEKSSLTLKSGDNINYKTGILALGGRKIERSSNLKISFSDPISHSLKPNTKTGNTVVQSKISDAGKNLLTTSTASSALLSPAKDCLNARPANKVGALVESNPLFSNMSSLYGTQSLDGGFVNNQLLILPNARSLPVSVPITNRTRSLDRYSSSETNLNVSPYHHEHFSRPGSAPGLMYEPVQYNANNSALQLSLYEMHALKKEEKFWSDIYSALPADMKHLITNRSIGSTARNKFSGSNTSFQSVNSSPAMIGNYSGIERSPLENQVLQRSMISKELGKMNSFQSSLGERIGNRLRMLHEMKESTRLLNNKRKTADTLAKRSASDSEYSFSSSTNFPMYWNLARRPHSDSAIDLLESLELQNSSPRISGSAYNSSEYLTGGKIIDKSQSYLASPSANVSPSPAPTQPIKLRDTVLRGDRVESSFVTNPTVMDNRSGFFSCLQNIESLTRQYEEEDRIRTDLESYEDEIYSDSGIPESDYSRYDLQSNRRRHFTQHPARRRNDKF